ncbi:MAG: amino acid adenylation domain-containing protein, partial [bacterium]|nr:amino acid adenylation domain-containing protein [bacterium]
MNQENNERNQNYSLSYHQERLWFIDNFEKNNLYEGSPVYHNIPMIIKLNNKLNISHLEKSINKIISNHEILRTNIITEESVGYQIIHDNHKINISQNMLKDISLKLLTEEAIKESQKPIDLEKDSLIKLNIFENSNEDVLLLIVIHHIIGDKISIRLIAEELAKVYTGEENSEIYNFPKSIQYKNYSSWQKKLSDEVLEPYIFYWKRKLNGRLQPLTLPETVKRPLVHTFTEDRHSINIPLDILGNINKISDEININESSFYIFAYKILMHIYSGQDEVVIGTSKECRERKGLSTSIGPYSNLIVLRSLINKESTFLDLLSDFEKEQKKNDKYKDLSFDKLVSILNPEKDMSRTALFDVLVQFNYNNSSSFDFSNIKGEIIETNSGFGKYDINLEFIRKDSCITGKIIFNKDIYSNELIENIFSHYLVLLRQLCNNINIRISDIDVLDDLSKKKQLIDYNGTDAEYPDCCIHEIISLNAEKYPENIAISYKNMEITYRELDDQSNQLSHLLVKKGIKRNELVALYFDKSIDLVISILAVLKVGAAYLPLDPKHPDERINFILNDSGVSVVLTQKKHFGKNIFNNFQLICSDYNTYNKESIENLKIEVNPKALCYCIYTSGSTGNPKGVLVEHQNVIRLIINSKQPFIFNCNDIWTFFHSSCFDFSVWEIFGPLLYGAKIVPVSDELTKDLYKFSKLLVEEKVTVLNQTPSSFYNLAEIIIDSSNIDLSLRYVIFGGEALNPTNLRKWMIKYPDIDMVNMYGITETSVHSTYKKLDISDTETNISNIGKPIPTTKIYLLNDNLKLVPEGVSSEIYISGDGLSRGYLNNDDLTSQRFIDNPFENISHSRLYRSGDLGRYLENGDIEYLGRIDNQVQIRGFRIELGEIEKAFSLNPLLSRAIVTTRSTSQGLIDIIAYYQSDSDISSQELITSLKKKIPDYMIPAYFIRLENFPLTANGKIDYKALPAPSSEKINSGNEYVAPSDEIEEELASIWNDILGMEKISIKDNFFDLGGNSIRAISLINTIGKRLNYKLELKDLFNNSTIGEIAGIIRTSSSECFNLPEIVIDKDRIYESFPLTDVQQAYWIGRSNLYELGNIGTHSYIELFFEDLDIDQMNYSINQLIKRHDMLRMVVTPEGQQRILPEVDEYQIEILDLRGKDNEEEKRVFIERRDKLSHQVFSGLEWPLFDIKISILKDSTYKLHYSMDALVMDGSSTQIFFREFSQIYNNQESLLPELNINFRDYVMTEQLIRKEGLDSKSREYWLGRMNTLPGKPELPLAKSTSEILNPHFERRELFIEKVKWKNLQNKINTVGVTPTVFFIQCFGLIMEKWSKNDHFLLNLTLFNRIPFHADVEQIVGDFTSLTLLELDYRKKSDFSLMLKKIQEQLWNDLEHKYFSGIEVQRELSRISNKTVLFPVVVTSVLGLGDSSEGDDSDNIFSRKDYNDELKQFYSITQTSQVWLDYKIAEMGDGLSIHWDFVQELFPAGMLDDMFTAFESLLNRLGENRELWDSEDLCLIPENHSGIQNDVNDSTVDFPEKLMHQLFVDQVEAHRGDLAVRSKRKDLTYGELYSISSSLGDELLGLGAEPNKLIAV